MLCTSKSFLDRPCCKKEMSLSRLNHRLPGGEAHPESVPGTAAFHHPCGQLTRPRPGEGQFFGQVGGEHFVSRCDATKSGVFRPAFLSVRGVTRRFCCAFLPFCEMRWLCVTHS